MTRTARRLVVAIILAVQPVAVAAQDEPSATDTFKQAGNFLRNCDARRDAAGERPEANYLCLSFVAGLIEGYTYAAVASGNERPYCLPRPTTLVEVMDMLTTVIERGVPATMPTAAVFHFVITTNFPCSDPAADGSGESEPDGTEQLDN